MRKASVSVLNSYFYAIKWHHNVAMCADPCVNKLAAFSLEGATRLLSVPVVRKEPISAASLMDIYRKYGTAECIADLRV